MSVQQLASATAAAYTTAADLAITGPNSIVSSNVVAPPAKTAYISFSVRLSAIAIMYIRSNSQNGAVLASESIPADEWRSFSMPWDSRSFSIRFSANMTVRDLIVSAELAEA